jgi:hypothetical protein
MGGVNVKYTLLSLSRRWERVLTHRIYASRNPAFAPMGEGNLPPSAAALVYGSTESLKGSDVDIWRLADVPRMISKVG